MEERLEKSWFLDASAHELDSMLPQSSYASERKKSKSSHNNRYQTKIVPCDIMKDMKQMATELIELKLEELEMRMTFGDIEVVKVIIVRGITETETLINGKQEKRRRKNGGKEEGKDYFPKWIVREIEGPTCVMYVGSKKWGTGRT